MVDIIYYTDPLCCWSWGMEPIIRRIQSEFGQNINWRICMGGLLPSWDNFHDPVNNVNRPLQMGPVWMHAAYTTGVPLDYNIWYRDPPASSYPSCIAYKAVELQSATYAATYLHMMREAGMSKGINIGNADSLIGLAQHLNTLYDDFDLNLFITDFTGGNGVAAFKKDLEENKIRNINRFPTFIIRGSQPNPLIISGYKPYEVLLQAIKNVCLELKMVNKLPGEEEYDDNPDAFDDGQTKKIPV